MSQQLGLFNFEQEVPHTAGSDCRDWNPCPPEPEKEPEGWDANKYYDGLKKEALNQMSVPESTTQVCCLTLAEQVESLETRYAQEHKWLNEAATAANCDLDQVAKTIYDMKWRLEPWNRNNYKGTASAGWKY